MADAGERHMLRDKAACSLALSVVNLKGRRVVEFGAGDGALTKALVKAGSEVVCYEIDPSLAGRLPKDADARIEDFTEADLSFLDGSWAVVSFPPYSLIRFVLKVVSDNGIRDCMLMFPEKMAEEAESLGFKSIMELDGLAFEPASEGRHLIMITGFDE